jgi:hypothetical protein
MATKTESTTTTPTPSFRNGVPAGFVPNVANLALDVVDRGQSTAIAVLQDARTELRTFVESGIDFAEKGASAFFRFARSLTKRLDDSAAETLTSTEKLIGGAVKSARETTKSATETANTALSGVVGQA